MAKASMRLERIYGVRSVDELIEENRVLRRRIEELEHAGRCGFPGKMPEEEKDPYLECKRKNAELIESEKRCRALIESSPDAFLVIDAERRIVAVNRTFQEMFGYEPTVIVGKTTRVLHPTEQSYRALEWKIDAALRGENVRIEWELMRMDGTRLPVEETIASIGDGSGPAKSFVAVFRDISKRKRAERELALYRTRLEEMVEERTRDLKAAQRALLQKEKLKTLGSISAKVAHEIRNPLTSIGGFAKRLQNRYPEAKEARIILYESERLEGLLNRIIEYLKPVEIKPQACDVNEVIRETLELFSPELDERSLKRRLELAPDLPPAYVDPGVLTQFLVNVIKGIANVMDNRGILKIRSFECGGRITVAFENPIGAGLKDPETIFLPFGEDSQLRMSVCSRLLEDMGGQLSFAQEQRSLTLTISLPKVTAEVV